LPSTNPFKPAFMFATLSMKLLVESPLLIYGVNNSLYFELKMSISLPSFLEVKYEVFLT
jgi:hypothetical protein